MHRFKIVFILVMIVLLDRLPMVHADVTPLTVWNGEARSELALWAQYWINFMFVMTATGLFFVRNHVEARWAVGAFVASHLASAVEILLFGADNFVVGMIAINHCIFWTPAVVYLARSTKRIAFASPFGIWLVGMLGIFAFSLIFDYRDTLVYIRSFVAR